MATKWHTVPPWCISRNHDLGCLLMSVASDLLNDALQLDNELSAWAATCSSRSVTEVTTKPVGYTFRPYKMANFKSIYLEFGHIDFAEFFLLWYSEKCLSYGHKISKWYDEPVLCYRRVKMCSFAMSKQGPSHYFHLHARAPPMAVPGCVDERMSASMGLSVASEKGREFSAFFSKYAQCNSPRKRKWLLFTSRWRRTSCTYVMGCRSFRHSTKSPRQIATVGSHFATRHCHFATVISPLPDSLLPIRH